MNKLKMFAILAMNCSAAVIGRNPENLIGGLQPVDQAQMGNFRAIRGPFIVALMAMVLSFAGVLHYQNRGSFGSKISSLGHRDAAGILNSIIPKFESEAFAFFHDPARIRNTIPILESLSLGNSVPVKELISTVDGLSREFIKFVGDDAVKALGAVDGSIRKGQESIKKISASPEWNPYLSRHARQEHFMLNVKASLLEFFPNEVSSATSSLKDLTFAEQHLLDDFTNKAGLLFAGAADMEKDWNFFLRVKLKELVEKNAEKPDIATSCLIGVLRAVIQRRDILQEADGSSTAGDKLISWP